MPSQYKDYVLFMLFIKYITDKYGNSNDFAPPVTIPEGASFKDMIALKGKSDIGDKINTQIIQPLIDANTRLARSDFPDFNDPNKDIKHVHLSVHPPAGRVTLVAPTGTRLEVAGAYALSKLGWIRDQQAKMQRQARETPRKFVERGATTSGAGAICYPSSRRCEAFCRARSSPDNSHGAPRQHAGKAGRGHAGVAPLPAT
jgi:hypothetical protein